MKILRKEPRKGDLVTRDFTNAVSSLFNRFFDEDFFSTDLFRSDFNPKVDVYEEDNLVKVKADIPGINEKDLKVELEDGKLTIAGTKEEEKTSQGAGYKRIERSFGSFSRVIALPVGILPDQIEADYQKGVLTVTIPKGPGPETKKIAVKVA